MNSRQRSFLRGMANSLQPLVTIGKQGLSESVIKEISEVLENKELVKITILKNSLLDPKDVINEAAAALNAEPVAAIGGKIILYRKSKKKGIEHIIIPLS